VYENLRETHLTGAFEGVKQTRVLGSAFNIAYLTHTLAAPLSGKERRPLLLDPDAAQPRRGSDHALEYDR
jgi:hypothetical protein